MSTSNSFIRNVIKSSVSVPWQMGFCDEHMPSDYADVILLDESEEEHPVKYLAKLPKLSRGWRDFAIHHNLQEGDRVSFHLMGPCKFKVYITRANELQNNVPVRLGKQKYRASCAVDSFQVHRNSLNKSRGTKGADGSSPIVIDVSDETSLESDYDSTSQEGQSSSSESSESALSINDFVDFGIDVNGVTLDSEIPPDVRKKYYQLCCSEKKVIHGYVAKGLDSKFAVSVIIEIVRIADSVQAATISIDPLVLDCMGKTLEFFEDQGFAIGSLRAKICTLIGFCSEDQALLEKRQNLSVKFDEVAGSTC